MKKILSIRLIVFSAIYLVRIMLWHNEMKRIEFVVVYSIMAVYFTYSLIAAKIKKDKAKIKKL